MRPAPRRKRPAGGSPGRRPTCPPPPSPGDGRARSADAGNPIRRGRDGRRPDRRSSETKLTKRGCAPCRSLLPFSAGGQADLFSTSGQAALADDEGGDLLDTLVLLEVGEQEGPLAAHPAGIAVHDVEIGAD